MNPFSTWTFFRRHKRHTALLLSLISFVTLGLHLGVALLWAISVEPLRLNWMFLREFSVVRPEHANELDPGVVAQIRANPDVARVVPATVYVGLFLPEALGGESNWFGSIALMEEDVPYMMERCGATLTQGRLLEPRTNGIMLSEQVAASLGLQVGDFIHRSIDARAYNNILSPMEVVGILKSDMPLAIISYEYLNNHELYRDMVVHSVLVVAREGRKDSVQGFLTSDIKTARTDVRTFQGVSEHVSEEYRQTYSLLGPIVTVVAIAMTLVVGAVNRIAFARRIPEFGILNAAGRSKRWLTGRLTMETAALASAGWVMGIALSWLVLYVLKLILFAPRGHDLDVVTLTPALFAFPLPIAVIGFTLISAARILSRLDPVAVVERGELTAEKEHRGGTTAKSSPKPLAAWTFYRRHRQQVVLLTAAMAMMIVAVVVYIFLFVATRDAQKANLGNLKRMSTVGSGDPAVVAQVRAHPAVERVIPFFLHMRLDVSIPPIGGLDIYPYGVYEEDMAYLVELYGLELREGNLPRPRTNDMVIPEAIAQNLDLKVGDTVRDPGGSRYLIAANLRSEFVVSGIFARPTAPEDENWLSFVSLEFFESHEAFDIPAGYIYPLIVVPKSGQKAVLDNWLENELASDRVHVSTYRQQAARAQERAHTQILTIALLESVIAVVAAVALAILNYISVSQRQSEFGVLHALGYSRSRLVRRGIGETAFTTGAAWGLSAFLLLIGLLYLQFRVFEPLGLRLNFFNLTPWLYTLPIPIAVLAVTGGTIAWTLSKLDPVSIIEKR
jgi:ABC-type lipoprotein release transport system permease subunit